MVFMITILLYLHASYYANLFILYRNKAGITTKKGENIDRLLSISEVFTLLEDLILNKI